MKMSIVVGLIIVAFVAGVMVDHQYFNHTTNNYNPASVVEKPKTTSFLIPIRDAVVTDKQNKYDANNEGWNGEITFLVPSETPHYRGKIIIHPLYLEDFSRFTRGCKYSLAFGRNDHEDTFLRVDGWEQNVPLDDNPIVTNVPKLSHAYQDF